MSKVKPEPGVQELPLTQAPSTLFSVQPLPPLLAELLLVHPVLGCTTRAVPVVPAGAEQAALEVLPGAEVWPLGQSVHDLAPSPE